MRQELSRKDGVLETKLNCLPGLNVREAFLCLKEIIFEGTGRLENRISDNRTVYYLKFPVQKWGKVKQTSRNRAFFVENAYVSLEISMIK